MPSSWLLHTSSSERNWGFLEITRPWQETFKMSLENLVPGSNRVCRERLGCRKRTRAAGKGLPQLRLDKLRITVRQ